MRKDTLIVATVLALFLTGPAMAGHPFRGWGGCGYSGFGGGFYSQTCYAGFNSPFVYGGYGCGYGSCYPGGYGGYYGYPAYNTFYYSPYYNPPVFAPAQAIYGPAAVRDFFGMAEPTSPTLATSGAVVVKKFSDARKVRESSPEYRRKADQFIAQGDVLFREQKYQQAIERYKTAGEMAPDMAEVYWRKGHAYSATRRYELAAANFRRALVLNPDIARDGFSLVKHYGDTKMSKEAHLEAIAGYCLENPDSVDGLFVLGIFLHYSGEGDRAEKFFARAAELAGPSATYLAHFSASGVSVKVEDTEL